MTSSTTKSGSGLDATAAEVLSFERFQLYLEREALLENGRPVAVGRRALAVLTLLAQQSGQVVSRRELQERVWAHVLVEDGTLRVHVAALQKALGVTERGGRYIENVPGRGYRLVVPVTAMSEVDAIASVPAMARGPSVAWKLPRASPIPTFQRIIGRARAIERLTASLCERRLITLTGPGGGGKTTVALGVAESTAERYPEGVFFVDLASVTESSMVAGALAASLGVAALAGDPWPLIVSFLRERRTLVILDNCEHVVDGAARLTQTILAQTAQARILATSREPLEVVGEWVYRLAPLEIPPAGSAESDEALLAYSAVQLFVERAQASSEWKLDAQALPLVVEICRRLTGNPLAIEITAARVDLLGLQGLLESLDQGLHLSIGGSRVAVTRHRTLRNTLDWSYELLPPREQAIFRRLGVFCGTFALEAATHVAAPEHSTTEVFESLLQLASKSLIVADPSAEKILYRLLDTPRVYALERLQVAGELQDTHDRHTQMWCTLGAATVYAQLGQGADWAVIFDQCLDDLRATIQWSFGPSARTPTQSKLRLFSLWFEFVLAAECSGWTQWRPIVLAALEPGHAQALAAVLDEMPQNIQAPIRVLTVTGQIDTHRLRTERAALWSLWVEHLVKRDFRIALQLAAAFRQLPPPSRPAPMLDELLTVVYHYAGELALATQHAERALQFPVQTPQSEPSKLRRLCHLRMNLARVLWLRGSVDAALEAARLAVLEGQTCGNAHLQGLTLLVAASLAMAAGYDLERDALLASLHEYAIRQGLEYFQLWVGCLEDIVRRDDAAGPLEVGGLSPYPLESPQIVDMLVGVTGNVLCHDTLVRVEHGRGGWVSAEVLRIKAEHGWRVRGEAGYAEAEQNFEEALRIARAQGALCLELRVSISIARMWIAHQHHRRARELLMAVRARFTTGRRFLDLIRADELLESLTAA